MRNVLLNLLYPYAARCLICGDPRKAGEQDSLCPSCREQLAQTRVPAASCPVCLSHMTADEPCIFCKKGGMEYLDRAYAPYRYMPASRALVKAVKFEANDDALPLLCDAMADALPDRQFDVIVPVPLHRKRMRERGVNQAMLLCQGLSRRTGIGVQDALWRTRNTRPQSKLKHRDRTENVKAAFDIRKEAQVAGLRVLLVDDVRTTGNTARACAQVLREHGAAAVSLCTTCVVWNIREDK